MLLLSIFSIQSICSISTHSATFDEVQNFGIGKYLLLNQKWDVMGSIVHPPLAYYISSIPLLFHNEDKRLWEYEETNRDIFFLGAVDVVRGQGLLSTPENKNDRLLILSRLTILALTLVLGYYIFRFTEELYGENGALLSLAIFSLCPNMLAYSGISTQDMPMAVFSFIACYYFWSFLRGQNRGNSLSAGLFLGFAIATKLTAILLIPFFLLSYIVYQVANDKRITGHPLIIIGTAVFILLASYGFNLVPFYQSIQLLQIEMNIGQAAFFHGELSNKSWWNFYPAVFLLKTPIPIIALFLAALVHSVRDFRNNWYDTLYLFVPIAALFIVFSRSNFAVGVRYLLPIYPFIFVMIGGLALCGKKIHLGCYFFVAWLAGGTFFVAPHYLAYFNEIIGGPANGYKYFVDSNLDWGQGLKQLKRYMDNNGVKRITLSYFGADSPQRYGIEYDWLPSHHLYNPAPDKPVAIDRNQLLAISATNLQGVYLENTDEFKWLRQYEPIATIGYSILIYDLNRLK